MLRKIEPYVEVSLQDFLVDRMFDGGKCDHGGNIERAIRGKNTENHFCMLGADKMGWIEFHSRELMCRFVSLHLYEQCEILSVIRAVMAAQKVEHLRIVAPWGGSDRTKTIRIERLEFGNLRFSM